MKEGVYMIKRSSLMIVSIVVLLMVFAAIAFSFLNRGEERRESNKLENGSSYNKLKMPEVLEDTNPDPMISDFVLNAGRGETEFLKGLKTDTLGYNGSYLGPLIRMREGEKVNISVNNNLDDPTTIHWHGLLVDGDQDGGPHQGIMPGESWNPSFTVSQQAATLWYHPHLERTTANQVYYGLAGLIYIDDEFSDSLDLPKEYGIDDIPLIVQDRSFQRNGNFDYRVSMMNIERGDQIVINGTTNPYVEVKRKLTRFRILNASNSQNFEFKPRDGSEFYQVASDGGFLEKPLEKESVFLSPGERAEVVVDFSKTRKEENFLEADGKAIMKFEISDEETTQKKLPDTLRKIDPIPEQENQNIRVFEMESMGISGTINGKFFDMNRIDEKVEINQTETWIVTNVGGMMSGEGHPFHVHGTQFQVITRNGEEPPPEELGFKDTIYVDIGEEVVVKVRFLHPGLFMYHCHILEHEDNGMMGQFIVE
jgi:blue copper oxidase